MLPNKHLNILNPSDKSRVIEMAWEDHTPFEAIETLYGLTEPQVIGLMRQTLKPLKIGELEFQDEKVNI